MTRVMTPLNGEWLITLPQGLLLTLYCATMLIVEQIDMWLWTPFSNQWMHILQNLSSSSTVDVTISFPHPLLQHANHFLPNNFPTPYLCLYIFQETLGISDTLVLPFSHLRPHLLLPSIFFTFCMNISWNNILWV